MVKNLPAMWETWVQSLGWEDPLEEGMAILAWRIPMDRGAWQATGHEVIKSQTQLCNQAQYILKKKKNPTDGPVAYSDIDIFRTKSKKKRLLLYIIPELHIYYQCFVKKQKWDFPGVHHLRLWLPMQEVCI